MSQEAARQVVACAGLPLLMSCGVAFGGGFDIASEACSRCIDIVGIAMVGERGAEDALRTDLLDCLLRRASPRRDAV